MNHFLKILCFLCFCAACGDCNFQKPDSQVFSPRVSVFYERIPEIANDSLENKALFKSIWNAYARDENPLYLESLVFLIDNLPGHFSKELTLDTSVVRLKYWRKDSLALYGKKVGEFPSANSLKTRIIIHRFGNLDLDNLKQRIDSFVRRTNASALLRKYPDSLLIKYALPFFVHQEAVDWEASQKIKSLFGKKLQNEIMGINDPVRAASVINTVLARHFQFQHVKQRIPAELNIDQIMELRGGMCEELSNISAYALRSFGLPVAIDFTPFWTTRTLGHQWLSLVDTDARFVSFDGTYRNPDRACPDHANYPYAKIFRHTYEIQDNPILDANLRPEDIPDLFKSMHIKDVTSQYGNTADIQIALPADKLIGNKAIYIAVHNGGQWRPIHYALVKDSPVIEFENMGKGVVYLPVAYRNNRIEPLTSPFLLNETGQPQTLEDTQPLKPLKIEKYAIWSKSFIDTEQDEYQLFHWKNNEWAPLPFTEKGDHILTAPASEDNLFRIDKTNADEYTGQHFVFIDGKQAFR